MKQKKITLDKAKGLNLDKEAIAKLQESQIEMVRGGNSPEAGTCLEISCGGSCNKASCNAAAD